MIATMRITLILLIFFPFLSAAQNVTITGNAPSYEYSEISVWASNDYISNTQHQLTFSVIDSGGNFLLELDTKEIQKITLKIDKNITSLFIEPNSNYEVVIFPADSTTYHNPNIEQYVKLSIKLKSKTEINALTMDFDQRFDDFLSFYYPSFVDRSPSKAIDSFKLAIRKYYSAVENDYFSTYVTYTIATIEEKTNKSEKKLFSTYIEDRPIQYTNPEYMNFFNTFYKQTLQRLSLSKAGETISFQINDRGSYRGAMGVMKRNPFLKNDTICELVLLKGMKESYYDGTFKRTSIVPILQQIKEESKIPMHQQIAINILNSFSKLKAGAIAPLFTLPDKKGVTSSLDELRAAKYVYLTFFESSCTACMQQMKVIPALKKKYGERITFISISLDKNPEDLINFCAKNPKYDWLFLFDNTSGILTNNYEIRNLPSYFLINPDGKFVQAPAEGPEGDIDRAFYDIVKPKAKFHNIGKKKND